MGVIFLVSARAKLKTAAGVINHQRFFMSVSCQLRERCGKISNLRKLNYLALQALVGNNKSSVKNKKLFERSEFFLFSVTFGFLGEAVQP